ARAAVVGHGEGVGHPLGGAQTNALPLAAHRFDACISRPVQVDKYQPVRFDCNRYSVPRSCAYRAVTVKGYIDRVEIIERGQVVARHARSYGREEHVLDPLHYLATLSRRPAALDHAPVLRHWRLPQSFARLRQRL